MQTLKKNCVLLFWTTLRLKIKARAKFVKHANSLWRIFRALWKWIFALKGRFDVKLINRHFPHFDIFLFLFTTNIKLQFDLKSEGLQALFCLLTPSWPSWGPNQSLGQITENLTRVRKITETSNNIKPQVKHWKQVVAHLIHALYCSRKLQ